MKILINTSTMVVGGGIQVAINFIQYTLRESNHDYYYVLSQQVHGQMGSKIPNDKLTVIYVSPAKPIRGQESKKVIGTVEEKYRPDIIYSVGAPSYVKFSNPEVLRLTNPMIIGGNPLAFTVFPFLEKFKEKLKASIQRRYIQKHHFIITQTSSAQKNIVKNLKIPMEKVFVVSNVYSSIFDEDYEAHEKRDDYFNILCFASPYFHKNLDLIPEVAKKLIDKGIRNFRFTVTLPADFKPALYKRFNKLVSYLGVNEYINNIGKVNFKEAPRLYHKSDMLFLPTLLEVFSVTYLEAMATGTPIVTTDLPFGREVCADAALYFEPKNSGAAADCVAKLIKNEQIRKKLIRLGEKRVGDFPKDAAVYAKHIEALEAIFEQIN